MTMVRYGIVSTAAPFPLPLTAHDCCSFVSCIFFRLSKPWTGNGQLAGWQLTAVMTSGCTVAIASHKANWWWKTWRHRRRGLCSCHGLLNAGHKSENSLSDCGSVSLPLATWMPKESVIKWLRLLKYLSIFSATGPPTKGTHLDLITWILPRIKRTCDTPDHNHKACFDFFYKTQIFIVFIKKAINLYVWNDNTIYASHNKSEMFRKIKKKIHA